MRFVPGRGAAARKFAAWANKVHSGSLVKYINPSHGISVLATDEIGVSISTIHGIEALFKLAEARPASTSAPADANRCDFNGTATGAIDHEIYFTYTPDYYGNGQAVRCQKIGGKWEVVSNGFTVTRGTAGAAITQGASGSITLSTAIGSTTSITATSELFDVEEDDLVYARYINGVWYLDAIECPE